MFGLTKRKEEPVRNPDSLEDMLLELQQYGEVWTRVHLNMFDHKQYWQCWVKMKMVTGTAEVTTEYNVHPTPRDAVEECLRRVNATIAEMTLRFPKK